MKRLVVVACIVVGLVGGAGWQAHGVALAAGGGNSDAAHACQQGGYLTLQGTDGTKFANTGQCVSFVARGGSIVGVSACTVTATTGCLTFDNITLPSTQNNGDTITLTGATSFVDACADQSGLCDAFPLPNDLATGGGTYVEKKGDGTPISSGTYRVADTSLSTEGLSVLHYVDGTGSPTSLCSSASGLLGVGVVATLIDSSTQATQTASIGATTGSLLPTGPLGVATTTETFEGPVPATTITC